MNPDCGPRSTIEETARNVVRRRLASGLAGLERGIKQAIIKQSTLQKKSKCFGSWQERAITLDVAGNFTWDGGSSHRNFVSFTAKTSVTLGAGGRREVGLHLGERRQEGAVGSDGREGEGGVGGGS